MATKRAKIKDYSPPSVTAQHPGKLYKVDPDQALAILCKRSFYRFVKEFWGEINTEKPIYNWHIEFLCNELQTVAERVFERLDKLYDLIINVPPGSTKSTIVTQMWHAWMWTRDPSIRMVSSSHAHALSLSHSAKTRMIVRSAKYRRLFPDVELRVDQQQKSDYQTTKGGQRYTASVNGSAIGQHAHVIVADDPINPQQTPSDAERAKANQHVTSDLQTRKVSLALTPTVLVMQRLHEDDPTGAALAAFPHVRHICLPAELREGNIVLPETLRERYVDGLLDPVRLSRKVLLEAAEKLGSYGYAGQYDQRPAPAKGGIFRPEWFEQIDWKPEYARLRWHTMVDTAMTKDEQNDPSGMWVWARLGHDVIVRHAQSVRLEMPELCKELVSYTTLHGYTNLSRILVEPKANGLNVAQTIKRYTKLNVMRGPMPVKDKVARARDVSPFVETGRIKLIRGDWTKHVIDQLCTFPNAKHDEYVDLLTATVKLNQKRRG